MKKSRATLVKQIANLPLERMLRALGRHPGVRALEVISGPDRWDAGIQDKESLGYYGGAGATPRTALLAAAREWRDAEARRG